MHSRYLKPIINNVKLKIHCIMYLFIILLVYKNIKSHSKGYDSPTRQENDVIYLWRMERLSVNPDFTIEGYSIRQSREGNDDIFRRVVIQVIKIDFVTTVDVDSPFKGFVTRTTVENAVCHIDYGLDIVVGLVGVELNSDTHSSPTTGRSPDRNRVIIPNSHMGISGNGTSRLNFSCRGRRRNNGSDDFGFSSKCRCAYCEGKQYCYQSGKKLFHNILLTVLKTYRVVF